MTNAVEVHPEWVTHPIVARAAQRADGDALETLLGLADALDAIERHLRPGMTIGQVLDACTEDAEPTETDRATVASVLLGSGCTVEEVDAIAGPEARLLLAERLRAEGMFVKDVCKITHVHHSLFTGKYRHVSKETADLRHARMVELIAEGHTVKQVAEILDVPARTVYRYLNGTIPKGKLGRASRQAQIAEYAIRFSNRAAAEHFGISYSYAKTCVCRHRKAHGL